MSKKSTISDIARELNITASTVSRALNDNPRISEETKKLVKDAAKRVGYQVNGVASALRSGRTHTIGVIVPTADRSFFASIVRGIEMAANRIGYNVMICHQMTVTHLK
jgi:LacI family transcriptional regulator